MSFLLGGETEALEKGGDLALRQIWGLNPLPSDYQPGGFSHLKECIKSLHFSIAKQMPGLCEPLHSLARLPTRYLMSSHEIGLSFVPLRCTEGILWARSVPGSGNKTRGE